MFCDEYICGHYIEGIGWSTICRLSEDQINKYWKVVRGSPYPPKRKALHLDTGPRGTKPSMNSSKVWDSVISSHATHVFLFHRQVLVIAAPPAHAGWWAIALADCTSNTRYWVRFVGLVFEHPSTKFSGTDSVHEFKKYKHAICRARVWWRWTQHHSRYCRCAKQCRNICSRT